MLSLQVSIQQDNVSLLSEHCALALQTGAALFTHVKGCLYSSIVTSERKLKLLTNTPFGWEDGSRGVRALVSRLDMRADA